MLGVEGAPAAAAGAAGAAAAADEDLPSYVEEFDSLISEHCGALDATGKKLGGPAEELASIVRKGFEFNRQFLVMAAKCKKPSQDKIPPLVAGVSEAVQAAGKLKDRSSPFLNHATAVAEGLTALQWVIVEAGPASVVESYLDGATFYLNKVRMEHKGKNQDHVDFCNHFTNGLKALHAFVKGNFKMGLTWNARGISTDEFKPSATAAKPAAAPAAAPPAPAKPEAGGGGGGGGGAAGGAASMQDVFGQLRKIDQSSGRTAGLRHVTKDMKAKAGGGGGAGAPAAATTAAAARPKPKLGAPKVAAAEKPKKPPRCELVKNRWFVEHQADTQAPIIIEDADFKQEVYIFGCTQATIIIKKKVKAVQIDSCKRCKVLFEGAVSTCELVNCQRMQVQVKSMVPSVAIDKTDGCVLYLSYASRETQVVTSKSSELNVSFPQSDAEDAEWVELPIPEQFVSVINSEGKVDTKVSELYA